MRGALLSHESLGICRRETKRLGDCGIQDRKSTRLNSSHLGISYAVFCLKKKPEQPHYVEELSQKLPFYNLRHLVRPGLTGWAQVNYGYSGDERDALEKLQYEFWYLQHQS